MKNRAKARSALAVLMSVSLALPPYAAYAEDAPLAGGEGGSTTIIENGAVVEGSIGAIAVDFALLVAVILINVIIEVNRVI